MSSAFMHAGDDVARKQGEEGPVVELPAFAQVRMKQGGLVIGLPGLGNDMGRLWVGTEQEQPRSMAFGWAGTKQGQSMAFKQAGTKQGRLGVLSPGFGQ